MNKFYDEFLENSTFLYNQSVFFIISVNNSVLFQNNFITNYLGIIEITISSVSQLSIGLNRLTFKFLQNKVFNDTLFQYEIWLEKNPIFVDIIDYEENLAEKEDLVIQLKYYYFLNGSIIPLDNQVIGLEIVWNQTSIFTQLFNTDISGFLFITIPYNLLNFSTKNEDIKLNFVYNGTIYLENKTISLNLNIINSNKKSLLELNVILLTTLSIILLLISLPLLYKFKKERKKILTEIIVKY